MALYVREVTEAEHAKLAQIVRAKTAPVRLVERARIVLLSAQGLTAPGIAGQVGVSEKTARLWIKRFNAAGLAGLDDAPRAGRPPTYSEAVRSRVIAKARARPPQPEDAEVPPTCHWTLDRLQAELNREGLPIKRSQIRRILKAEHIKWQKPRTWLESDDPEFAEKRGPSSGSTPLPQRVAR
jgi:transposase